MESLDRITNADLDQMGSLVNPHALIKLVVEAIGVILDVKPVKTLDPNSTSSQKEYNYWIPMNIYLCDPYFITELKSLDIQHLDEKIIDKVTEIFKSNANFKPEKIARISNVAECLCRWVFSVVDTFNAILRKIDDELQKAKKEGKKEWGRSKIMIVGEGRAGKTAFANSLIGKDFEHTESTRGIHELTCDVKHAAVSEKNSRWGVFKPPEKEYETVLAKMIYDKRSPNSKSETLSMGVINAVDANIINTNIVPEVSINNSIITSNFNQSKSDNNTKNNNDSTNFVTSIKDTNSLSSLSSVITTITSIENNSKENTNQHSLLKSNDQMQFSSKIENNDNYTNNNNDEHDTSQSEKNESNTKVLNDSKKTEANTDNILIMKTLADKVYTESKFILSVYDFGGQSVFDVIHPFFLTQYGIYIIVFDMEWLIIPSTSSGYKVDDDVIDKEINDDFVDDCIVDVKNNKQNIHKAKLNVTKCMAYLTFWINSVLVHTSSTDQNNDDVHTAPIAFVGTHRDIVSDPNDHEIISNMLQKAFNSNIAFRNRIQYQSENLQNSNLNSNLNFFPIDNTNSQNDDVMLNLMKAVEEKLGTLDYVHEEKDLSWFQILDAMHATKRSFLTLNEVQTMAQEYNVLVEDVSKMLSFFHQVGVLMWHDEESLKDVVIIDPIQYFVTPATIIICNHRPTKDDATVHYHKVYDKCKKYNDWDKMLSKGIVSEKLMKGLLDDYKEQYDNILQLMVKYSLAIYLPGISSKNNTELPSSTNGMVSKNKFVIPALLPIVSDINKGESLKITFYFMFTADSDVPSNEHSELLYSDLKKDGFLPSGLFERLIGHTLAWSQETHIYSGSFELNKNQATLFFGSQMFRLTEMRDINCIRVEVDGLSPNLVYERLTSFLTSITTECLKSLRFSTLLPYTMEGESECSKNIITESSMFVRLGAVREIESSRRALNMNCGGRRVLLNIKEANDRYESWMLNEKLLDRYDVFISHRCGRPDDDFVEQLFDRLTLYQVENEDCRSINTFLDKKRLKNGDHFQSEYCKALVNSSIVTPIISPHALEKMVEHDPSEADHVLVEWICALYCLSSKCSSIHTILPIAFGKKTTPVATPSTTGTTTPTTTSNGCCICNSNSGDKSAVSNRRRSSLFLDPIKGMISKSVPSASCKLASKLLKQNGIICSYDDLISTYTVKYIVDEMFNFLLIQSWEMTSDLSCVAESYKVSDKSVRNAINTETRMFASSSLPSLSAPSLLSPEPVSIQSNRTLADMIKDIKLELDLKEIKHKDIIEAAIDTLSMTEECSKLLTLKEKASLILKSIKNC
eukprot:gene465-868_t